MDDMLSRGSVTTPGLASSTISSAQGQAGWSSGGSGTDLQTMDPTLFNILQAHLSQQTNVGSASLDRSLQTNSALPASTSRADATGADNTTSDDKPKKRRKKDKLAPKKPRSAYIVFLDRHRDEIRTAHPGRPMKEITSELAKRWRNVTKEEMDICEGIASREKADYEQAKKRYLEEKAAATGETQTTDEPKKANKRAKKDKAAPKKGRSAFILFLMDYRKRHKQMNNSAEAFSEVSKQVGEVWSKMTAEERAPYVAAAQMEAAQYKDAKQLYLIQKQHEESTEASGLASAEAKSTITLGRGRPPG